MNAFMLVVGFLISSFPSSFDPLTFVATVNGRGQGSMFRDQEVIHSNVQLPIQDVTRNAMVGTYVDGEPCIGFVGRYKMVIIGYLLHAVTLREVRSMPCTEDVFCICINATGTKMFLGTETG